MIESFSDFGVEPNAAFRSSLQNFCTGSLHVMLSGLWGISDPDQVLVERCTCGKQGWILHIGNLVRKAAGGIDVPPPADLMPVFDELIQQLALPPSIHWGRIFYANMPNMDSICEVLLDNEAWPAGESTIRNASWPKMNSFYSTRMFWMTVPQSQMT
jgi:hypothetical protein